MNDLIGAHLDWAHAANLSPRTIDIRRIILRKADRELPHGLAATDRELAAWLGRIRAAKTKSTYYMHLASFYRWAVQDAHLRRHRQQS